MSKRILKFVTGNKNKLAEVKSILNSEKIELSSIDIDLPELQGDPEFVATQKCLEAAKSVEGPVAVITEDASLCFDAWQGLPGVYIKWFLSKLGPDGLSDVLNHTDNKAAYAECIFAYCDNKKDVKLFIGRVNGVIVPPRGPRDFGWDPCFQPLGYDQTYAEMPKALKNTMSHRFLALQKLKAFLEQP